MNQRKLLVTTLLSITIRLNYTIGLQTFINRQFLPTNFKNITFDPQTLTLFVKVASPWFWVDQYVRGYQI